MGEVAEEVVVGAVVAEESEEEDVSATILLVSADTRFDGEGCDPRGGFTFVMIGVASFAFEQTPPLLSVPLFLLSPKSLVSSDAAVTPGGAPETPFFSSNRGRMW